MQNNLSAPKKRKTSSSFLLVRSENKYKPQKQWEIDLHIYCKQINDLAKIHFLTF